MGTGRKPLSGLVPTLETKLYHLPAGYSDVTLFEKTNDVGGVWQKNYAGFRLQVSRPIQKTLSLASTGHYSDS